MHLIDTQELKWADANMNNTRINAGQLTDPRLHNCVTEEDKPSPQYLIKNYLFLILHGWDLSVAGSPTWTAQARSTRIVP